MRQTSQPGTFSIRGKKCQSTICDALGRNTIFVVRNVKVQYAWHWEEIQYSWQEMVKCNMRGIGEK